MVEGLFPRFDLILMAEIIWGLGATFLSGATQAWISDEIGDTAASRAFLRAAQVQSICTFVAIPLSVALASWRLNAPIIAGAALLVMLAALLAVVLPETGRSRRTHPHAAIAKTLRSSLSTVRRSNTVLTLLMVAGFLGAASEGFDRLWTPHVLHNFVLPSFAGLDFVAWFGVLRGGGMLLTVGATQVVQVRLTASNASADQSRVARALFTADALRIASIVAFALTSNFFVALVVFWVASVLRTVSRPVYTGWLNNQLDSSSRATVLSMSGQMDSLGQIVLGPAIGVIAAESLRAGLVIAAAALSPVLPLYVRALRAQSARGSVTATEASH